MEAVTAEAMMFVYARKQLGVSQRGMAMRLKVNQSSISKIESGVHHPRLSTIRKLEGLMRLPAEQLAGMAMGKTSETRANKQEALKPTTCAISSEGTEPKVLSMDNPYWDMDTTDLEYLKSRYFVDAFELDRKAQKATHALREKELRYKLHRLTMDHLEYKHAEAADMDAFLRNTNAPAKLQTLTEKALDKAATQLKNQQYKGIHIRTAYELMREQMKIDQMLLNAELLRTHVSQIENALKKPSTTSQTGLQGQGRVAAMECTTASECLAMVGKLA